MTPYVTTLHVTRILIFNNAKTLLIIWKYLKISIAIVYMKENGFLHIESLKVYSSIKNHA